MTALLIVACTLTAAVVFAEIKTYSGTGRYVMSDFENQKIAKMRARQRAEKDAQKQAGVYLKTFSRTVNLKLADDEITAVTNNITNIVGEVKYERKIAEADGETVIIWTATLTANIDTDGIYDWVKRGDKDKVTIVHQNDSLQDAIQKNDELSASLTEQYNRATSQAERDKIRKQMKDADRDFLANQKKDEGNKFYYDKDFIGALNFSRKSSPS